MQIGNLTFKPITEQPDLVAQPIQNQLVSGGLGHGVYAVAIDPSLSDTTAFCQTYNVPLEISANCIVVEAKRAERTWYAACLILATDMIDVNGKVRRQLDARKISFAPKDTVIALTHMEYGGITPVGLPTDWPILIDEKVAAAGHVIIGGGVRGSKILIDASVLAALSNTTAMDIAK